MEDGTGQGLSTRCVHAGDARDAEGALHAPLYNHTTFGFASTADLARRAGGPSGREHLHAVRAQPDDPRRRGRARPTWRAQRRHWPARPGMAAESAAILGHVQAGDHVVCIRDVHGGTQELLAWNRRGSRDRRRPQPRPAGASGDPVGEGLHAADARELLPVRVRAGHRRVAQGRVHGARGRSRRRRRPRSGGCRGPPARGPREGRGRRSPGAPARGRRRPGRPATGPRGRPAAARRTPASASSYAPATASSTPMTSAGPVQRTRDHPLHPEVGDRVDRPRVGNVALHHAVHPDVDDGAEHGHVRLRDQVDERRGEEPVRGVEPHRVPERGAGGRAAPPPRPPRPPARARPRRPA